MPLLLVLFWEKQSLRASILNPFCISIFVIAAEYQPAVASEDSNQDVFVVLLLLASGGSIAYISLQFSKVDTLRVSNKEGVSILLENRGNWIKLDTTTYIVLAAAAAQTINSMTDTTTFISTYLKGFRFESRQSIVKANLPVWRGQRESMGNTSCAKIELSWFLYLHYIAKWCRHFKNEYTLQRLRKSDLFMILFVNQYG